MAVITITIIEAEVQLMYGIPKCVTLETNVPATIFYTFDGEDPTVNSSVYVDDELIIPVDQPTVIFKVFATNGVDSSAIIERTYRPVFEGRISHAQVIGQNSCSSDSRFPYTDFAPSVPGIYGKFGPNDAIVDKPDVENIPDGFDGTGTGTPSNGTDLDLDKYLLRFSESNYLGERGRGLGTLPTTVSFLSPDNIPQSSNANDKLFNPRAMVIYQDSREEPFDSDIAIINRNLFSLEDANIARIKNGILLNTTGYEGMIPTGSALRSQYNARDNTITYYYFDSRTLRWIISTEPAPVKSPRAGIFNIIFASREPGDRYVFRWHPFKGRRLI